MDLKEFERFIQPMVLNQTLGEDIGLSLKKIIEDKTWPFSAVVSTSPLKALAFYSFDKLSEQEQKLFLNK